MLRFLFAIALSTALAAPAMAWDPWPCEVMLCLANPQGPTAASACVPPITKLWSEMKKPRFKMPTCDQVGYPDQNQMMTDIKNVLATNPNATAADISAGMTQAPVITPLAASVANVQIVNDPLDPCEGGRTQAIVNDPNTGMIAGGECRGPLLGYTMDTDGNTFNVYEGYSQKLYSGQAFDVYISNSLWQRVRPDATGGAGVTYTAQGVFGPMPPAPPSTQYFAWGALPPNTTLTRSEGGPVALSAAPF